MAAVRIPAHIKVRRSCGACASSCTKPARHPWLAASCALVALRAGEARGFGCVLAARLRVCATFFF